MIKVSLYWNKLLTYRCCGIRGLLCWHICLWQIRGNCSRLTIWQICRYVMRNNSSLLLRFCFSISIIFLPRQNEQICDNKHGSENCNPGPLLHMYYPKWWEWFWFNKRSRKGTATWSVWESICWNEIKRIAFEGTGSYPEPPHGWQRQIRLVASHTPRPAPCIWTASKEYWEQVGI